jgi:hypothetical protein
MTMFSHVVEDGVALPEEDLVEAELGLDVADALALLEVEVHVEKPEMGLPPLSVHCHHECCAAKDKKILPSLVKTKIARSMSKSSSSSDVSSFSRLAKLVNPPVSPEIRARIAAGRSRAKRERRLSRWPQAPKFQLKASTSVSALRTVGARSLSTRVREPLFHDEEDHRQPIQLLGDREKVLLCRQCLVTWKDGERIKLAAGLILTNLRLIIVDDDHEVLKILHLDYLDRVYLVNDQVVFLNMVEDDEGPLFYFWLRESKTLREFLSGLEFAMRRRFNDHTFKPFVQRSSMRGADRREPLHAIALAGAESRSSKPSKGPLRGELMFAEPDDVLENGGQAENLAWKPGLFLLK